MRWRGAAFLALALLPAACKKSSPTPAALAPREDLYVQVDAAVGPGATRQALLQGLLVESPAGFRPDPSLKDLAALTPGVTAEVYSDEGFLSVAFAGAASRWPGAVDGDLGRFLGELSGRPESVGASLYRVDDTTGEPKDVAAVAGHDLPEAAMALLDVWSAPLELDYALGPPDDPATPTRARLLTVLKSHAAELERRVRRLPGAKVERSGTRAMIRFSADADSFRLAREIATDLLGGQDLLPKVVTSNGRSG